MEAIKPQDLHNEIGKTQSTSWFVVNQEMINTFADVTDDPQFIHVDPERAKPIFGSTIAHGALMSLYLLEKDMKQQYLWRELRWQ